MEAVKQDYIFISYSRDDLPKVRPVVEEMRNSGYSVWNDTKILPGEDWTDHIASHIANCAVCVAFHSQTSRDSPHCREEIHYALKHGKKVISVYLEDVTLKEGLDMQLARFQSVKYAAPSELLEILRQNPDFERCGENVIDGPKKRNYVKRIGTILKKAAQSLFRAVSLLVAICLLAAILAVFVIYVKQTPICFLDESGVLDIISLPFVQVEMPDYDYQSGHRSPPPWGAKTLHVQCAVIRKGVTYIGESSFQNCSNMKSVFIPDGVISIGSNAFSGCTELTKIDLPDSLKLLDEGAFSGCSGLEEINIPENVEVISDYLFSDCTALKKIHIPYGVTTIGFEAFSGCTRLESISFPRSVFGIEPHAFSNCTALKQIKFSNGIWAIYWGSFQGCTALENIIIPNSVRIIGEYAFSGCSNLKTVHIQSAPERVQISATTFEPETKIIYEPPVLDIDVDILEETDN